MTRSRPSFGHSLVARTVFGASGVLLGLGLGLLVAVNGCEEQASTPPAGQGGSQGGGLSQNPKSLMGRSAKTAKDVAQQAENKQAEAAGMADEMSGQAGGFEIAGLVFPVPTSWTKVPPASTFIASEFRMKGEGGDARVTVSHFPGDAKSGAGGGIDMNVQRWESQFADASGGSVVAYPTKRTVAGCTVTMVNLEGTMKAGMPGGPTTDTPNTILRGALIEGPQGLVVFKMTGPKATVEAAAQEWDVMIEGMTKKAR